MNNIADVKREIEDIIRFLVEYGLSSFQQYPVIREHSNCIKTLEWSLVSNLSISLKNLEYQMIYTEIDKNKDYTLKLIDGNIIQMMYAFKNNQIISHRLAMFPSPNLEAFQNEPEIYENDQIYADIIAKNIVTFPIRFDFDKDEIVSEHPHPHAHATLGQYKNCRIPIYGPLSPQVFMRFILQNFYSSFYYTYLDKSKNGRCNRIYTIRDKEKESLHFNIC